MNCRVCDAKLRTPFLNLGNSPVSNNYLTERETHESEIYYPLEVFYCPTCHLVQIAEYQKPENIFNADYAYFSSYSESWLLHCKEYADQMINRFALTHTSSVLEVGSNDGYLLQYFKDAGVPVRGVDPAESAARIAEKKGIQTDIMFFNYGYVIDHPAKYDLIIANNVLAHNPDLNGFVESLQIALKPTGVITVEVPHLYHLIKDTEFDTIYQEHYSYFSVHALRELFRKHGLDLFDVDEIPTHGGSIRVYAKHESDTTKPVSDTISKLLYKEKSAGLTNISGYLGFAERVKRKKREILKGLVELQDEGKLVVGYGAPAKGNTLLNYCGIRDDLLLYTVDANPKKQGRYLPGTHIPVHSQDRIRNDKPDYIVILPWNIKDEIINQLSYIGDWGGKFILLLPDVRVVSP